MISDNNNALVTWGQVLRISLLPTALADILAGFALAGLSRGEFRIEALLFLSSALIYHGSMALNDWVDYKEDCELRPERPLPRGLIQPMDALRAAGALILVGISLAATLSLPLGTWMAGIASLAVGYNVWLRGKFSGPLSLGVCRGMHLAAPIILLAPDSVGDHAPLLIGYGLYVFALSSLARLETKTSSELKATPRILIGAIAAAFSAPLLLVAVELDAFRGTAVSLLAVLGAGALLKAALPSGEWTPARVQAAVGISLRLLLVYTAATALTGPQPYAWVAAPVILAGYPLAHGLRKVFPPT